MHLHLSGLLVSVTITITITIIVNIITTIMNIITTKIVFRRILVPTCPISNRGDGSRVHLHTRSYVSCEVILSLYLSLCLDFQLHLP